MWEMAPGGLGGVWARDNTREAIWDAMYRGEVYCTSGTRPTVRVFGGWDFTADEIGKPEWAWVEQDYRRGVPMGGDLVNRPEGKAPTCMVKAVYDPEGAYLDRVQIIKGWLDANGETHEKIVDVAWSGVRRPGRRRRSAARRLKERDLDEYDRRASADRLLGGPRTSTRPSAPSTTCA
jgi:hypothetical protein